MNIDLIYAKVKIYEERASKFDVNIHLQDALDEISNIGFQSSRELIVKSFERTDNLPESRTQIEIAAGYNYVSASRCLILPNNLNHLQTISFGETELEATSQRYWHTNCMPPASYYPTDTHEVYLSFELNDDDVVKITGRWRVSNIDSMPDKYLNYFIYYVLSGLFTLQYPNTKMREYYEKKLDSAYSTLSMSSCTSKPLGRRNEGILP